MKYSIAGIPALLGFFLFEKNLKYLSGILLILWSIDISKITWESVNTPTEKDEEA
jgi:hypothetical protein